MDKTKNPVQKRADIVANLDNLGPILVGVFVTGKVEGGSRINPQNGGKKESFAFVQCGILANRQVYKVNVNERDPEAVQRMLECRGDIKKEELYMPCPAGSPCIVYISSVKNDKGLQSITGRVHPLAV